MKLSPLEIRKHEFSKQMSGYDKEEVRSFLEMIADDIDAQSTELKNCKATLDSQQARLKEYKRKEQNLQDALLSAQHASQAREQEASKEALAKVQNAELEAEEIIADARKEKKRILAEIDKLEGQRQSYLIKVSTILQGQVELLKLLEGDSFKDLVQKSANEATKQLFADQPSLYSELERLDRERIAFVSKMKKIHSGQLELLTILQGEEAFAAAETQDVEIPPEWDNL